MKSIDRLTTGGPSGPVTVTVIGAGHAGLAMSHCLAELGIEHVILERGRIGNSWLTERWDSLRLLTPNWLCRLPGYAYRGDDPDGYMTAREVARFLEDYALTARAPVCSGVEVLSVCSGGGNYRIRTTRGEISSRVVVLASGMNSEPAIPPFAGDLPPSLQQVTARTYRNPHVLPEGGVLVVGASATGLQLAEEIHRSGRPVTLSTGEHVRLPRSYRGFDIQHWMLVTGVLDQHYRDVDDLVRARRVPSPQLVGSPDRSTLDLNRLTAQGVQLVGRFAGCRDDALYFSGSLANVCNLADLKMKRLMRSIDDWIAAQGLCVDADASPCMPTRLPDKPVLRIPLKGAGIRTVVWATGYRESFPWLHLPVFDGNGRIIHDGGVVSTPGIYVMGLGFMRRRKSSFIHGAEDDARDLAAHVRRFLDNAPP